MEVHFITPLVCSFVTILMIVFTFEYLKSYRKYKDRQQKRMLLFMVVMSTIFLAVTVFAYLSSFDII